MPEKTPAEPPRIAELKRRLAQQPASRLFIDLAREYFDAGQLEAAADVCARGLKKHPTYLSARVLMGRVCFDMGRTEEAREAMETVLTQAPDNLVARRILAEICLEQGDVAGALERFRALLAFSPGDADTKVKIDQLETKLRTPPEPAAPPAPAPAQGNGDLEPGVLATPTLAEIYLQQGLMDKAALVYREILKGDPNNVEAQQRLAEMDPPAAPPDPATLARRRKIAALNSWLDTIRGAAHRGAGRV